MRAVPATQLPFLFLLALGAALALLNPGLLPFLAGGVLVRFVPALVRVARRRPRLLRRIAAVLGAAVSFVAVSRLVAPSYFGGRGGAGLHVHAVVPVDYVGRARYDGGAKALVLAESATVTSKDIEQADAYVAHRLHVRGAGVRRAIARAMRREGWRAQGSNLGLDCERTRHVPLKQRTLPAQTANAIPLPSQEAQVPGGTIDLPLARASHVTIDAKANAIGETFPHGTREHRPVENRDLITVSVPDVGNAIEYELRGPWFQNGVLAKAATLSLSGGVGWILAILLGLAGDEVKAWLKGGLERLRRGRPPDRRA